MPHVLTTQQSVRCEEYFIRGNLLVVVTILAFCKYWKTITKIKYKYYIFIYMMIKQSTISENYTQ